MGENDGGDSSFTALGFAFRSGLPIGWFCGSWFLMKASK